MDERNCIICTKKFIPLHYGREIGWWCCSPECYDKQHKKEQAIYKKNLEKQEYEKIVKEKQAQFWKELILLKEQVSHLKHKIQQKNQIIDFLKRQLEQKDEALIQQSIDYMNKLITIKHITVCQKCKEPNE